MSNDFTVASQDRKRIAASLTTAVGRPKESEPRDQLYTDSEIARLCFALGFDLGNEQGPRQLASGPARASTLFAVCRRMLTI